VSCPPLAMALAAACNDVSAVRWAVEQDAACLDAPLADGCAARGRKKLDTVRCSLVTRLFHLHNLTTTARAPRAQVCAQPGRG
jgi:hypothetical protein